MPFGEMAAQQAFGDRNLALQAIAQMKICVSDSCLVLISLHIFKGSVSQMAIAQTHPLLNQRSEARRNISILINVSYELTYIELVKQMFPA